MKVKTASEFAKKYYQNKTISEITKESENINPVSITHVPSSATRSSFFIASSINWVKTVASATLNSLFRSTPSLPPAQHNVACYEKNLANFSQIDVSGGIMLADLAVRKFTGAKYSQPLNDSLSTFEKNKMEKFDDIERGLYLGISIFNKYPSKSLNDIKSKCPNSLLNNATISKGICYQNSR
ncbi:hypothetical protein [Wolbachia endosymbiont of Pentidionis agamae]|uniref:hypothetical protein n=1 Tax=Wolbachia endosymbiont of Pentidionis agamae TaxID=3110435 RepID=UPI002FD49638